MTSSESEQSPYDGGVTTGDEMIPQEPVAQRLSESAPLLGEDERRASKGPPWMRGLGVIFVTLFVIGIGPGFAGLLPVLMDGHVYESNCNLTANMTANMTANVTAGPKCQEDQLSNAAGLALIIMNSMSAPAGLVVDLIGARWSTVIGTVAWAGFNAITGVDPQSGNWFAAGFTLSNAAVGLIFFAFLADAEYLKPFGKEFGACLLTGLWDLSSSVYVLVNFVYFSWPWLKSGPLYVVFLLYSAVFGGLSFSFLAGAFPPCQNSSPVGGISDLKIAATEMVPLIKSAVFWSILFCMTMVVTYGYFWISSIVEIMVWKGASQDEGLHFNFVFSIMLPIIGFVSSIGLGLFLQKAERKRPIFVVVCILEALFSLSIAILVVLVPYHLWVQYVTLALVIVWRISGFAFANTAIIVMWPGLKVGKILGITYSVSGLLAVALNRAISSLISMTSMGSSAVHLFFGLCCAAAFLALAAMLYVWLDDEGVLLQKKV